jgi:integrase/recombinase XerD
VSPLSADEVSAMIGAISSPSGMDTRNLAFLLLLLDTGARLGEIARMSVTDAADAARDGLFKVMGKGARERYLPVGNATLEALRRYMDVHRPDSRSDALFLGRDGRPLADQGLRQIIRRVARRAGIEGVHPHRLRHTFAVNYLINGGDAMTLQRILGHSTLEMVRRYVNFDYRAIKQRHAIASPSDRFWHERGLRKIV